MPDFSHFHRFQPRTNEWYSQNVTIQLSMCKNDINPLRISCLTVVWIYTLDKMEDSVTKEKVCWFSKKAESAFTKEQFIEPVCPPKQLGIAGKIFLTELRKIV